MAMNDKTFYASKVELTGEELDGADGGAGYLKSATSRAYRWMRPP